jgi:hypothetical protein
VLPIVISKSPPGRPPLPATTSLPNQHQGDTRATSSAALAPSDSGALSRRLLSPLLPSSSLHRSSPFSSLAPFLLSELGLNPRLPSRSFVEALSSPPSVATSQRGELLTQHLAGSCLIESCFLRPHITTNHNYPSTLLLASATSLLSLLARREQLSFRSLPPCVEIARIPATGE